MLVNEIFTKIVSGETELIQTYVIMYSRYNSELKVQITPEKIKLVLSKELQIWADFLCFNDILVTPNHENEDNYEDMWYVLQKISTPFIDGEISIARISDYLSELNKKYK